MNTLSKTKPATLELARKNKISLSLDEFYTHLEDGRWGYIPMILIVMVCLGGITAAFAVQHSSMALLIVAMSTMMVEVLVVAVAPMRAVAIATLVAFLIDVLVVALTQI